MIGSELTQARAKRLIGGFTVKDKLLELHGEYSPERLLASFRKALVRTGDAQRKSADELDMLNVLGVDMELKEAHHSRFLAWLLEPTETHAQGNLFFRIILGQVGLPGEYADAEYEVEREVQGDESRIDIEIRGKVCGPEGFLMHIENKIGAGLGENQLEREDADLRKRAERIAIPIERTHGLLLKPVEESTKGTLFRWVGWDVIEQCLQRFAEEIHKAPQNRAGRAAFAAEQYRRCILRHAPGTSAETEEENDEQADRS